MIFSKNIGSLVNTNTKDIIDIIVKEFGTGKKKFNYQECKKLLDNYDIFHNTSYNGYPSNCPSLNKPSSNNSSVNIPLLDKKKKKLKIKKINKSSLNKSSLNKSSLNKSSSNNSSVNIPVQDKKKKKLKINKKNKITYSSSADTIVDYETDSDCELDDNKHILSYGSFEKFIFYGIEYQKDYENNVYIYNDNTYILCGKYDNGRICKKLEL